MIARVLQCLLLLASLGMPATSARSLAAPPSAGEESVAPTAERHILVTFPQSPARRPQRAGSTPRAYGGNRAYKSSPRAKRAAARLARAYGLRAVDAWPIQALSVHCVVYELPAEVSPAELIERLADDPRVESVQQMQLFKVLASYNDPYLELQHGIESMQVEQAHLLASGQGVRVAVIDTGVDVDHPELQGRIAAAENFVDKDANGFTGDIHGTAVAGVIASVAGNGIGIVGVAPAVEILALKACWQETPDSVAAVCNTFTLAKAISYAMASRSQVLNLSLAGPADRLLSRLIARAIEQGIVVIGAAGPDAAPGSVFPSASNGVITVAANGEGSGAAAAGAGWLPARALTAPGLEILTIKPYGAYDFLSGSSLAAAHVSGIVALLLERDRKLSPAKIHALLRASGGSSNAGVNACTALTHLLGSGSCPRATVAALHP